MWNHNSHFHNYLLRQLPSQIDRALDIGCGLGVFALKLAERSQHVDAIDSDHMILNEASTYHHAANIFYQNVDFLEADLPEDAYDAIVFIASLHHMDLETALKKIKMLLRPSGKLIILGLYQERTILDYIYSLISIPLNIFYANWHRPSIVNPTSIALTRPPQLSLQQIKAAANTLIPGFRLQRHLFWRYSLIWQKH